jgi:hypothetical protein
MAHVEKQIIKCFVYPSVIRRGSFSLFVPWDLFLQIGYPLWNTSSNNVRFEVNRVKNKRKFSWSFFSLVFIVIILLSLLGKGTYSTYLKWIFWNPSALPPLLKPLLSFPSKDHPWTWIRWRDAEMMGKVEAQSKERKRKRSENNNKAGTKLYSGFLFTYFFFFLFF